MFVRRTSRLRFEDYRKDAERRRKDSKGQPPVSYHGAGTPPGRRHRPFFTLIRQFWSLLGDQRPAMILALGTLTLATLLKLVPPAAVKIAIDSVLSDRPSKWPLPFEIGTSAGDRWRMILVLAGGVVVVSVFESALHLWGRWYATRATKRLQVSVRKQVFEHAVRLPLHRVYQLKSGGVASILREDAGSVGDLIFSLLYNPWRAVIQLLGSLVILTIVDWRLLLGSLALIPLVILSHRTWVGRLRPIFRDIRKQREEIDAQATEAFGGMRVVRAFGRQRRESARFISGNHLMTRQELLAWWWSRGIEFAWEIVVPLASSGLLLYGGWQVLTGELSLGDLTMFLFYLALLLGPLAVLANSSTQFQTSLAALDRVLDLLAEPLEMPATAHVRIVDPRQVRGEIELQGVGFQYPTSTEPVLHHIDLHVRPGEMIAFVGPSGAGKTTLCNLVARFYDPSAGRILLDGADVRDIELQSYRRLLGIVEQEVFLFDGSVAENVGYGAPGATRDQIREACRAAHAADFIEAMEHTYDTRIGERGVRLSGGQRQRIAIARAILADPRILILDEATSNLDTESERAIQQSLLTLMKGRTSFVIAHRLSTISHADRIVVLEHGRILETGTHAELMEHGGRYRDMVRLQLGLNGHT
jgi:ATP-binding cassette subfamily B protein/subfamily B ATP-binding cassette protein MsbA